MELTIKIEDPEFEKSIVSGVNQIKDDQLVEIVCKCVEAYLSDPKNIKELLVYRRGYNDYYMNPTPWLENLFGKYEGKAVDDMRDEIVKYMKENYQDLVFKALLAALSKQLLSTDFKMEMDKQMISIADSIKGSNS